MLYTFFEAPSAHSKAAQWPRSCSPMRSVWDQAQFTLQPYVLVNYPWVRRKTAIKFLIQIQTLENAINGIRNKARVWVFCFWHHFRLNHPDSSDLWTNLGWPAIWPFIHWWEINNSNANISRYCWFNKMRVVMHMKIIWHSCQTVGTKKSRSAREKPKDIHTVRLFKIPPYSTDPG